MTPDFVATFDAVIDDHAPIEGESLQRVLAHGAGNSPQLRTLCAISLAARQPMVVLWGKHQQLLYNDAYAAILGERHPSAFGQPILRVWAEIADVLEPLVSRAYAGESIQMDDIALAMVRNGVPQDAHFSFSFTPIYGATADEVLGVFCVCAETTDLVRQEKARKDEHVRRLRLFDNTPGFMAVMSGPEHVFEFANKAYYRATGDRDLIGRSFRHVFPEVEQRELIALLDRVYASGQRHVAKGLTLSRRAHAGQPEETLVLDFVYEPIADGDGAVTGIFVAGLDATESVGAHRAARESHARRTEVLDSMGEGFVVLDRDFRVIEINAEGVRLDGRTQAQIVGCSHWELWPTSIGTAVEHNYRRVMTERVPLQFQHHHIGEQDYCLEVRAYPVNVGIAVFYRDITTSALAETELRHSNDRFRAATEAVGVMWTNGANGRMRGEQPGWAALTGQSQAEYSGFGWADAVHPQDAQPTIDAWNQAVAEQRLFVFEHRVRRSDGAWRRFAIRAVPVLGPDGSLREWVGVHIDITDAALVAEALRAADRRKDEFLATLAHELRNPLAATRAAAELLARPELPPERRVWAAGVIARQSHVMSSLLDELLDLSRFRSGSSVALRPERIELATLVESAIETVSHLLETKRHQLSLVLPDAPLILQVDRLRTSQVLINLLTNAAKYTDPGGQLQIVATSANGFVSIDIVDNGIGLATDSMVAVFGMFTQLRGETDRSDGGLGIGLTLAKRLVELQGGRIDVFSDGLGCGSVFRVVLPVAVAQALPLSNIDH